MVTRRSIQGTGLSLSFPTNRLGNSVHRYPIPVVCRLHRNNVLGSVTVGRLFIPPRLEREESGRTKYDRESNRSRLILSLKLLESNYRRNC